MPRRAASGHIPATQLSNLAAASRIAAAVISGCPEAPPAPLQAGAAPLLVDGAEAPAGGAASPPLAVEPVKMRSKKLSGPDDCAEASADHSATASVATTATRSHHRTGLVPVNVMANPH